MFVRAVCPRRHIMDCRRLLLDTSIGHYQLAFLMLNGSSGLEPLSSEIGRIQAIHMGVEIAEHPKYTFASTSKAHRVL